MPCRRRKKARKPLGRADPQPTVVVAQGGINFSTRQSIGGRVVSDVAIDKIELIESLTGANVNAPVEVFGDGVGGVSRKTLRSRVVDEVGTGCLGRINAADSARCRAPQVTRMI